ncbi:chemotaxis protein CheW [Frigidibacter sp. MR17.14]|uniref:chemotaxis protein CheW n=1 Tax=Frigidibacter sp. MR17.14 TaxID=3126509 RepID=UPI0030130D02
MPGPRPPADPVSALREREAADDDLWEAALAAPATDALPASGDWTDPGGRPAHDLDIRSRQGPAQNAAGAAGGGAADPATSAAVGASGTGGSEDAPPEAGADGACDKRGPPNASSDAFDTPAPQVASPGNAPAHSTDTGGHGIADDGRIAGGTAATGAPPVADAGPGAAALPTAEAAPSPLALIDFGAMTLGIEVRVLREVMVAPQVLQPFVSSGTGVVGCVALRGQVIPVVDLAPLIGLPPLYPSDIQGVVVIVGAGEEVYGILARAARQIVAPREIARQAIRSGGQAPCDLLLTETVLIGERVVSILDAEALPAMGVPLSRGQRARTRSRDAADHYLVFEVEGAAFCLSLARIQATIPESAVDGTVLRSGPCDGSVTHHGIERALVNLPPLLGTATARARPDRAAAIVLPFPDGSSLALRADRVIDIRSLTAAQLGPMPAMLCRRPELIAGAHIDGAGRQMIVLDGAALLEDADLGELARLSQGGGTTAAATATGETRRETALLLRAGIACAITLGQIEEIISLPADLQRDLGFDDYLGTIAARDRTLLPVFSLAALHGHPADGRLARAAIVVLRQDGGRIGLMVEEICSIETMIVVDEAPDGATATLQRSGAGEPRFWHRIAPDALPLYAQV